MVAITIGYLAIAYTYTEQARLFPVPVGWLMLLLLALDLVSRTKTPIGEMLTSLLNPAAEAEGAEPRFPVLRQLSAILWVAFFTAAMVLIGIMAAVPLYVFGSMRFHGRKSYLDLADRRGLRDRIHLGAVRVRAPGRALPWHAVLGLLTFTSSRRTSAPRRSCNSARRSASARPERRGPSARRNWRSAPRSGS